MTGPRLQFCLFVFFAGALPAVVMPDLAVAETSKHQAMGREGICDALRGATPGLHGLCVSYCEAHDCVVTDGAVHCDKPPSAKILEQYNRLRTDDDPQMPCILPDSACPCFNAATLEQLNLVRMPDQCVDNLDLSGSVNIITCTSVNSFACNVLFVAFGSVQVVNYPDSQPACAYLEAEDGDRKNLEITSQQAAACSELLQEFGRKGGWECFQ